MFRQTSGLMGAVMACAVAATAPAVSAEPGTGGEGSGAAALWSHLVGLDRVARDNARIEIELGSGATADDAATAASIAAQWNGGAYDAAIDALRVFEMEAPPLALGVSWRTPVAMDEGFGRGVDRRIGAPTVGASQAVLEYSKFHQNLFVAVSWMNVGATPGWSLNMSTNHGSDWSETYYWMPGDGGVVDIDIARLEGGGTVTYSDMLVAYIWSWAYDEVRIRHFDSQNGGSLGGQETLFHDTADLKLDVALEDVEWTDGFDHHVDYACAAIQSDGDIRLHYSGLIMTVPAGAAGGLDLVVYLDPDLDFHDAYISFVGTDNRMHVWRDSDWFVADLGLHTGDHLETAISTYWGDPNRLICVAEMLYSGQGIQEWRSEDGGGTWTAYTLANPGPAEGDYQMPVLSRHGFAAAYGQAGSRAILFNKFDPSWDRWHGQAPINDELWNTGSPLSIEWIPPAAGEYWGYGIVYIHAHGIAIYPLFDRAPGAGGYCFGYGAYFPVSGWIDEVAVGSINIGSGQSDGFEDYGFVSTSMEIGTSHPITVTAGSGQAGDRCGVWVDWNRDYDFDDWDESITMTGSPGPGPYTGTVTPPGGAFVGETRMRVRIVRDEAPQPCGMAMTGEVEDYTIDVLPGYCAASGTCGQYISRVAFAGVDHESECDGYSEYDDVVDLHLDQSYPVTITIANGYAGNIGGLWIDWNHDLVFDLATEGIPLAGSPGAGPYTATIVPPAGATIGETTMRVRVEREVDWPDPCDPGGNGEVEDFRINVRPAYCEAIGTCAQYISRVQTVDMDNQSGCDGYTNYGGIFGDLMVGQEAPITVTVANGYAGNVGGLWIDWNHDLDFSDLSEAIDLAGSPGAGPYTATVVAPPDALPGQTRMRVRVEREVDWPDPCRPGGNGEVEDYAIDVIGSPYCAVAGGCYYSGISGGFVARVEAGDIDNLNEICLPYSNYTNLSTSFEVGEPMQVMVTAYEVTHSYMCGIWIDWDHDLVFDEPRDLVAIDSIDSGSMTATAVAPNNAAPGPTTMRVRIMRYGTPVPCGDGGAFGETEDYTVVLTIATCPGDVTGDGIVSVDDLLVVLGSWGPCPGCPGDITGDDLVGVDDLLTVLGAWGPCE